MAPSDVDAIDDWRRRQPDTPNRSAAIRRLVKKGLKERRATRTLKTIKTNSNGGIADDTLSKPV
jgi:hypothetical protein